MTFLCVVCAKTVRGRQLLVGVAREGGRKKSAAGFLLHLAYDCYGSVSSRREGEGRELRLGVASLYKIMCFALRRH